MLTFRELDCPDRRFGVLEDFNPLEDTWIVPDLEAKSRIQKLLLKKHNVLPDHAVLRAREFWVQMFQSRHPEFRIISEELVQCFVRDELAKSSMESAKRPGAARAVLQVMNDLVGVFSHPEGAPHLSVWLQEHEAARIRWGHWFVEAHRVWLALVQNRLMSANWVGALLVHEPSLAIRRKRIIADLGPQMEPWESELFGRLSQARDVQVLLPFREFRGAFGLPNYRHFNFFSESNFGASGTIVSPLGQIQLKRFATQLAEVKEATAQVRTWADSGIPLEAIGILGPDFRDYATPLREYFRREGIPWSLKGRMRLISVPEVKSWLAVLSLRSGEVRTAGLEQWLFGEEKTQSASYERFFSLFENLYDSQELKRDPEIEARVQARGLPKDSQTDILDFLAWATQDLREAGSAIQNLVRGFVNQVPPDWKLPLPEWLSLLRTVATKTEIATEEADVGGALLGDWSEGEWEPCTHFIFLGCSSEFVRQNLRSPIARSDIEELSRDLGFNISLREQNLDYFPAWIACRPDIQMHLYFPENSFSGDILQPSPLWQSWRPHKDFPALEAPQDSRWDLIQKLGREVYSDSPVLRALENEIGRQPFESFGGSRANRLSASSLQDYQDCPFKYAASRLMGLADIIALDLDLDVTQEGKLLHGIVEILKQNGADSLTALDVIEQARISNQIPLPHPNIWKGQEAILIRFIERFKKAEAHWKAQRPWVETIACELEYRVFLGEDGVFTQDRRSDSDLVMSGRIDRIDGDREGQYFVIDYKRSGNGLTNWDSWLKNRSFQLLTYAAILESGVLPDLKAGRVLGAHFYNLRDLERKKGFQLEPDSSRLFESQKYLAITSEEKSGLFTEFREILKQTYQDLRLGRFPPQPENPEECKSCHWRTLCRAPHLR